MENFKIAYVGNFSQRHCTEVHIARTLEQLGHSVTEIQEDERHYKNLPDFVKGHDLFLFTRTWNNLVTLDHLAEFRKLGIPSISYHLDLYVGLQREDGLDKDPFWKTDFVFSPDGDPNSAEVFGRKKINHYWMKPGVVRDECYLSNNYMDFRNDIIFVGGGATYGHPEWPYRKNLVTWLEKHYGRKYKKFGHPEKIVRNEDLNSLYAESKITIGDSLCLGFNHEKYWSDRICETTGRGGFIIHPYIKGLEECYENEEEVVFYQFGNFKQLKEKIDYYLKNENEREAIRIAGHERTKRDHTYHNRLTEMLEIVKRKA